MVDFVGNDEPSAFCVGLTCLLDDEGFSIFKRNFLGLDDFRGFFKSKRLRRFLMDSTGGKSNRDI